jgi:hypothetical protein
LKLPQPFLDLTSFLNGEAQDVVDGFVKLFLRLLQPLFRILKPLLKLTAE